MSNQLRLPTKCGHCGRVLGSPTAAAKHVMRHPAFAGRGTGRWGPDAYVDGETWGDYSTRTTPPNRAQEVVKRGGNSPSQEQAIQTPMAWQMTERGASVGPHRHRDKDHHCIHCGARDDRGARGITESDPAPTVRVARGK